MNKLSVISKREIARQIKFINNELRKEVNSIEWKEDTFSPNRVFIIFDVYLTSEQQNQFDFILLHLYPTAPRDLLKGKIVPRYKKENGLKFIEIKREFKIPDSYHELELVTLRYYLNYGKGKISQFASELDTYIASLEQMLKTSSIKISNITDTLKKFKDKMNWLKNEIQNLEEPETGSEKQVKWAKDILERFKETNLQYIDKFYKQIVQDLGKSDHHFPKGDIIEELGKYYESHNLKHHQTFRAILNFINMMKHFKKWKTAPEILSNREWYIVGGLIAPHDQHYKQTADYIREGKVK